MAFERRFKHLWQAAVSVRAGDKVNLARFEQSFLEPLGHTAEDADYNARAGLALDVELLDSPPDTLLGIVPDRAGVGEDHVRKGDVLGPEVTLFLQYRKNNFAVRHIHLASICLNIYLFHLRGKDRENSYLCDWL